MPRTVYTSGPDGGRSVPEPGEGAREPASLPPEGQRVRVRVERAGRGGKTVTVASPFALARAEAEALLRELRRACGGGGSLRLEEARDGRAAFVLELQGDHRERLPALLRERGFRQARG
jgi:translation initiation factor 1